MKVIDIAITFLNAWKPTVRSSTYNAHSRLFILYLQPIADIEVKELTTDILQQHLINMRNRLQACTVSQWQNFLKRCFAYAKQHNRITKDITAKLMNIPHKSKPVSYITPEQFYMLVKEMKTFTDIEGLEEKILFLETLFITGMRHSECRALQIQKIDFINNRIIIDKAMYCDYVGIWELTDPKTRTSFRTISIPKYHTLKIKNFIEKTQKNAEDFLFSYRDGSPRLANFAKWPLEKACKKLNIKVTTHGLRHSHATFLRQSGLDLEKIQKRLGHSNVLITMHYSHAKLNDNDIIDVIEKKCYPLSKR